MFNEAAMATYRPTIEDFRDLAHRGNLVPVYQEVDAALETPLSAYLKVAHGPHSFLLESVEGGERMARYSFLGTDPYRVVRTGPGQPDGAVDPLPLIEAELGRFDLVPVDGLPRFLGITCAYRFQNAAQDSQLDCALLGGIAERARKFAGQ